MSDGVDQIAFEFHRVQVPPGALHDDAQLRIRAEVDGPAERWYVDDVQVDDDPCGGTVVYCAAVANSVSATGAGILSTGSVSIAANDLTLVVLSCPALTNGIMIFGDGRTQTPLGDGFLCIAGTPIFRAAVVQADLFGTATYGLDQGNLPAGSVIAPGDVLHFQFWFRDSIGSGVNLSNGLQVEFCP